MPWLCALQEAPACDAEMSLVYANNGYLRNLTDTSPTHAGQPLNQASVMHPVLCFVHFGVLIPVPNVTRGLILVPYVTRGLLLSLM